MTLIIKEIPVSFDDLERKLDKLSRKKEIKFPELFNPVFMRKNSSHSSIQDFINSSSVEFTDEDLLSETGSKRLDQFVSSKTNFMSWREMRKSAWDSYVQSQLAET